MRRLAALPILLVLAATASAAEPLSGTERKLVASVDEHRDAHLALLEQSVNLNSGTLNFEGVRAVGRLFAPRFEALGFETRWVEGAAWNRAGHLIATRAARATKAPARPGQRPVAGPAPLRVLLIGHLDTVFEADHPFQRFERLDDSTARGPGVIDMKGGDVIMLLALQALADAGELDRLEVTVVLTGDEERIGEPRELARRDLLDAASRSDVAIGFEDGAGDPRTAVVARRGSSDWLLRVRGTPAHSSQIFRDEVGAGAVFEAARILDAFRDSLAGEPYLTFSPAVVVGGTHAPFDTATGRGEAWGKLNVVAESTVVAGDLRALSIEQRENAKRRMRAIVAAHLPRTDATIRFVDGYPPLAPTEGNRRLLARYDQASRDLGLGPVEAVDPIRAGAADISFTAGTIGMAIDGVGLMGRGGHTASETADLRTLASQAKRMAVLLSRMARAGAKAASAATAPAR